MKLREILQAINGRLISTNVNLDREVDYGAAADLMSDVLTFTNANAVLITGLTNSQVVRTAEMADVAVLVFCRGKIPSADTRTLAEERGIPLVVSDYTMFEACGRLFAIGLRGSDPIPPNKLAC